MYRLRRLVGNLSLTLSLFLLLATGATAQVEKSTNDTKTKTIRTENMPAVPERGSDLKMSSHVVVPSDPVVKILKPVAPNFIIPKVDNPFAEDFDPLVYLCGDEMSEEDSAPSPDACKLPSTPNNSESAVSSKDRHTSHISTGVIQVDTSEDDPLLLFCAGGAISEEEFAVLQDLLNLPPTANNPPSKSNAESRTPDRQRVRKQGKTTQR